jgi:hypothetical protein
MQRHLGITLRHPIVWIKDKYRTGLNRKDLFIVGLIPALLGALVFIADSISVLGIKPSVPFENAFLTLIWMLFCLSVINLIFVGLLQRNGIRL